MPPVFIAPAAWQTDWLHHPAYAVWAAVAQPLAKRDTWPDQAALDSLFAHARQQGCPLPARLRCVLDAEPDAYYESHIASTGEVPTRSANWHDWFNALAWLAYPRLKTALNARHQAAMAAGEARRGPIRDSATLLDECGILIPYAETAHAEAIDQMRWSTLWLTHRADWGRLIDAYPVGHRHDQTEIIALDIEHDPPVMQKAGIAVVSLDVGRLHPLRLTHLIHPSPERLFCRRVGLPKIPQCFDGDDFHASTLVPLRD